MLNQLCNRTLTLVAGCLMNAKHMAHTFNMPVPVLSMATHGTLKKLRPVVHRLPMLGANTYLIDGSLISTLQSLYKGLDTLMSMASGCTYEAGGPMLSTNGDNKHVRKVKLPCGKMQNLSNEIGLG